MFSVRVMKHLLERSVIVIHILEDRLIKELWLGQGLCEGLDISLHEVVGLGLITCAEVGLVRRHRLLVGGVQCYYYPPRNGRRAAGTAGD